MRYNPFQDQSMFLNFYKARTRIIGRAKITAMSEPPSFSGKQDRDVNTNVRSIFGWYRCKCWLTLLQTTSIIDPALEYIPKVAKLYYNTLLSLIHCRQGFRMRGCCCQWYRHLASLGGKLPCPPYVQYKNRVTLRRRNHHGQMISQHFCTNYHQSHVRECRRNSLYVKPTPQQVDVSE